MKNIKKIINSPLLSKAELARKMWPDTKSARSKLNNKLKGNVAGSGKQRMTDDDWKLAETVIKEEFEI